MNETTIEELVLCKAEFEQSTEPLNRAVKIYPCGRKVPYGKNNFCSLEEFQKCEYISRGDKLWL